VRILHREPFRGRRQQNVIYCHKEGWCEPMLMQQAPHCQGAGELHGIIGP
jgi:hypothetical protein